jgi:cobalt-zinc-cadmium efflux system outer membrane protein
MKKILICFYFLVTLPLHSRTSEPIETLVHTRTGMEIAWQKEEAVRDVSSKLVRTLLRQPLTIASAVQIAILNNRNLQATFEEIGIAQSNVREALTVPNPSLDFDVQFPASPNTLNRYGWLIGQEFAQILMMPLKKRISEQALEAAELRVAAEVLHLVAEVKKSYFTLQADLQFLAYLRIIQETHAISLEFAQKQYQAGNTSNLALLQYQDSYNEGRLEIADAESICEQHRENLNILLGLWGKQTNWKIQGELPLARNEHFSNKQLESLAITQRLDLRAARYRVASLTTTLGLTETFRWLPILDFGFSGERDNDASLNMGPAFRVELPIFNQGQFRVERSQAGLSKI